MNPFHIAVPVKDLASTREFYVDILGCAEGRSAATWVDFDFFGHQLSAHVAATAADVPTNEVDGDAVPVRHFGLALSWDDWETLAERLLSTDVDFLISPRVRFRGEPGEQGTFFIVDPSGNALEFKGFRDPGKLFERGAAPAADQPG